MAREGLTAFQAVNRYFEEAAHIVDLDDEMHSILTSTYREIVFITMPLSSSVTKPRSLATAR